MKRLMVAAGLVAVLSGAAYPAQDAEHPCIIDINPASLKWVDTPPRDHSVCGSGWAVDPGPVDFPTRRADLR